MSSLMSSQLLLSVPRGSFDGLARSSCGRRVVTRRQLSSEASFTASRPIQRLRRALQYIPGSFPSEKLLRAASGPADGYIFDLEDSVNEASKDGARRNVSSTLQLLNNTQAHAGRRAEHLVRVNHTRKRLQNDLAAVFEETSGALDTILIPKVSSAGEVLRISEVIDSLTSRDSRVGLIASIESAKAIVDLKEIATSSPRLTGLMFAAEDYCADAGVIRTPSRREMLFARSSVVNHAKAFNLSAIDMVCIAHKDMGILREESKEGAQLGFTGKQVIHPAQVDTVQRAFGPSPAGARIININSKGKDGLADKSRDREALARAHAILEQMEKAEQEGRGAYSLTEEDGSSTMIDAPMILQAKAVVESARQAGMSQ